MKRKAKYGQQQESATSAKKTKIIVNVRKTLSSICSELAVDQLPGFSGSEEENALAIIVKRSCINCAVSFIVWTKSRLLRCCINVHVSVLSGQSMDNNNKKIKKTQ